MQLPETEYNPDEKYQHPEPGSTTRTLNESIPSIPTPTEQEQQTKKNTKETIQVPTSLIRWACYTVFFAFLLVPIILLIPVSFIHKVFILNNTAAILGHFAGQLNKLIDK